MSRVIHVRFCSNYKRWNLINTNLEITRRYFKKSQIPYPVASVNTSKESLI